jgi:hypothetical protein
MVLRSRARCYPGGAGSRLDTIEWLLHASRRGHKKYGRSIAEWQGIIGKCGLDKHMAIESFLTEYQMGQEHANALVGCTLAGNIAKS